jgi:hypothetical protein
MRYDTAMPRPVTLAEIAAQALDVWAWCNDCFHHAVLPIDVLTEKLGTEYPVPQVGRRTYCRECGSRDVATRPDWPRMGVIARH